LSQLHPEYVIGSFTDGLWGSYGAVWVSYGAL
jgi:hypothetical protein